jgi:hypothetical protein
MTRTVAQRREKTAILLTLCLGLVGCGDSATRSAPFAPSSPSASQPTPQPNPPPTSTGTRPTAAAIEPKIGATQGGAWGTITGTNFEPGAMVKLGGRSVQAFVVDPKTINFWTVAHVPGYVDVVVSNPGGLSTTLDRAFTFAPRELFDFNGDWIAHAGGHYETDMRFTVRNNVLVSVSCGTSIVATLSPSPSVANGEFSFRGDDGFAVSGTLVSPKQAVGTIVRAGGFVRTYLVVLSVATAVSMSACGSNDPLIAGGGGSLAPTAVAPNCTYAVSPVTVPVSGTGGTPTVTVTTGNTCAWTATSNSPFITVNGGGSGNGAVNLAVAFNSAALTGGGVRSGTATIAGHIVTVNQSDH